MTALEKFRQQVAIARGSDPSDMKSYVVQTADEAQALLDELDGKGGARFARSTLHTANFGAIDAPGDDEVV